MTKTTLRIEFMYIDLQTCGRCLGTEEALDQAIENTKPALSALGIELEVIRTLVATGDHARSLRFLSSPTIRVAGQDVASELRESNCGDCGDICGTDTDCRVWSWHGEEFNAAPVGLLTEAILKAAVADEFIPYELPKNLETFFAKTATETPAPPCCDGAVVRTCC